MKYRTTKKEVNAEYLNKIYVKFCALQNLLVYETETSYIVSREGWAADIYDFGTAAIITGRTPFGNVHPSYDVCKRYDSAAEEIRFNYSMKWEEQKPALQELLRQFIEEVTKKDEVSK